MCVYGWLNGKANKRNKKEEEVWCSHCIRDDVLVYGPNDILFLSYFSTQHSNNQIIYITAINTRVPHAFTKVICLGQRKVNPFFWAQKEWMSNGWSNEEIVATRIHGGMRSSVELLECLQCVFSIYWFNIVSWYNTCVHFIHLIPFFWHFHTLLLSIFTILTVLQLDERLPGNPRMLFLIPLWWKPNHWKNVVRLLVHCV